MILTGLCKEKIYYFIPCIVKTPAFCLQKLLGNQETNTSIKLKRACL